MGEGGVCPLEARICSPKLRLQKAAPSQNSHYFFCLTLKFVGHCQLISKIVGHIL